jgi:hypothetical protein
MMTSDSRQYNGKWKISKEQRKEKDTWEPESQSQSQSQRRDMDGCGAVGTSQIQEY